MSSNQYNSPQNVGTRQGMAAASEGPSILGRASCNGARSCGARQHHGGCQGHRVPAAGDTQMSPWLSLPGQRMVNVSHAGSPGLDIQVEPVCV